MSVVRPWSDEGRTVSQTGKANNRSGWARSCDLASLGVEGQPWQASSLWFLGNRFLQGKTSSTKIKAPYTYLETQKIKDTIIHTIASLST